VSEGPATRLVELARRLRADGVRVGAAEVVAGLRALAAIDASRRDDARLALQTVFCSRCDDLQRFDAAFEAVFGMAGADVLRDPPSSGGNGDDDDEPGEGPQTTLDAEGGRRDPDAAPIVGAVWSDVAVDRAKNFAEYTDEERAAVRRALERLARRTPRRRSRRTRPTRRRRGNVLDLRGTVRASLPLGGEPVRRQWRGPTERPRPLVFACDVSGSMEPYARMLLQYVQACVTARRRVEVFAFGTRLTRITHELAVRDPDDALARAAEAVTDWSGGTRIGASIGQLNREHAGRLGRGAVVVVLSDGWDRGDPDLLGAEMARLRQTAHRVVWVNPLAAQPDYQPLARGMRAAIPHTERLLPGESLRSLEELVGVLEEL
jgi:hypothetical protein